MRSKKRTYVRSSQMASSRIDVFFCRCMSSTSLAHNSALDVEDVDVEKREDKRGQVLRALRAVREPALFISSKSNLPFFDLGHSGRRSE